MPTRPAAPAARRTLAHALLVAGALGAVLPAAGCARAGGRGTAAAPAEQTTVRVRNQAFLDMNIYVIRGGARSRLGTVSGNSTQVLRIPSSFVQALTSLRFLADPIGGRGTPVSDEITVSPGDEVTLTIPPR